MKKESRKFDRTIVFVDDQGVARILFRLINFGKNTDELKFIFIQAGSGFGTTYFENPDIADRDDILSMYAEITYHYDGTFLHKFPSLHGEDKPRYINPTGKGMRRTPIPMIREWEPILKYTILKYTQCQSITYKGGLVVPRNEKIFNGEPFECIVNLGHMMYANPENSQPTEMIFRVNDVAKNLDLILWFYKSPYKGKRMRLQNTDLTFWADGNVIEVVKKTNK